MRSEKIWISIQHSFKDLEIKAKSQRDLDRYIYISSAYKNKWDCQYIYKDKRLTKGSSLENIWYLNSAVKSDKEFGPLT